MDESRQAETIEQLRAALRAVEWIKVRGEDGVFYQTCPSCWADFEARGDHVIACALRAALRETP